jgi:hypothetical protein
MDGGNAKGLSGTILALHSCGRRSLFGDSRSISSLQLFIKRTTLLKSVSKNRFVQLSKIIPINNQLPKNILIP